MQISKVFVIILSLFPILSLAQSQRCNPNDKKVLLEIKKALGNPYALASWDPNTDCCHWYVVECGLNSDRITQLHLFAANVSGQIPAAVGDLPYLELLMFHKLNLSGPIPSSITKLKNLKLLDLSWNHLSGSVPPFLSKLKNLTFLDLSFNNFTGSIPSSLSEFPNLDALHLDRNSLTGQIPDSLGKFAGIVPDLYLSHNQLTGEVPRSLGNLNYSVLDFSRNKLQGDISFLFGKNKSVTMVDLSRNMLEFDISKVEFPDGLTNLDLNHNSITGNLPQGLVNLNDLQLFNVSYNRLCGQIPQGGKLQSFDETAYFHNRCLCGAPLPQCR